MAFIQRFHVTIHTFLRNLPFQFYDPENVIASSMQHAYNFNDENMFCNSDYRRLKNILWVLHHRKCIETVFRRNKKQVKQVLYTFFERKGNKLKIFHTYIIYTIKKSKESLQTTLFMRIKV